MVVFQQIFSMCPLLLFRSFHSPALPFQPVIKPQYVDHIPKAVRGNVLETLKARDQKGHLDRLMVELELEQVHTCMRGSVGGRKLWLCDTHDE
jgi:translation initiation factor RLI1